MTERASREALTDAGLGELVAPSTRSPSSEIGRLRERFGCSIGSSKGNLEFALHALDQLDATDALDARFWTGFVPDALASRVMARHGLMGPSRAPVAACATGLIAVIEAANWIIDERCEVAIAGSADASLIPLVVGSYERMKVLAPFDAADAAGAVRPFSADRQGFVVGEGAALFVLEEHEHAARRRARIHAELAGWAMRTSPGASLVALDESPDALVHCIRGALDRAELAPDRVGHVNCHGTATKANDRWETLAIRRAFGAAANRLKLTANKSMIGHLLGAAGSVELAATVLALRDQFVPPTRNLRVPDPECDLDYTPEHGAPAAIDAALKLSFGFGGHVAAVALLADDASATS
jgi:3-oxoacyl-(acyl-carrier-protein) synthase